MFDSLKEHLRERIRIGQQPFGPQDGRQRIGKILFRWLMHFGVFLFALVLIGAYCVGIYACFILGRKTFSPLWNQIVDVEAVRTFFPALIAVIGGPLLIWRVVTAQLQATAAQHQVGIARQAHYTDLFTKAVEQLGAVRPLTDFHPNVGAKSKSREKHEPNLEVRLGAIFILDRIAQESEQHYWPVMEVLCAYLRNKENTGEFMTLRKNQDVHDWINSVPLPRLDVQTALTVIGRRSNRRFVRTGTHGDRFDLNDAILQRASFERCSFSGIDLSEAHLENARFSGTTLTEMVFDRAHLQHSRFFETKIRSASFQHVNLFSAQFSGAELSDVFLWDVQFVGADFDGAKLSKVDATEIDLKNAHLFDADFSGVKCENPDFLDGSLGDESTKIPSNAHRPTDWPRRVLEEDERSQWISEPRRPPA
jgi:hypothetical protein